MKETIDYPMLVEGDAKENPRAYELFDMIVAALKKLGVEEWDAYTLALITYAPMADVLRKRNWE